MTRTALLLTSLLIGTGASATSGILTADTPAGAAPYVLSSKNGKTDEPDYAYSNPYGVGPANDSR
jgi:hypothetical protein